MKKKAIDKNWDECEEVRDYTKLLPVKLTTDEKLTAGARLAELDGELHEASENATQVKQALKAEETRIVAERTRVAGLLRRGTEMRDVKVQVFHDYEDGELTEVRVDTFEVVFQRPLTEDEKQPTLPEVEPDGTGD